MLTEEAISKLAKDISSSLLQKLQWPEVMDLETAARYLDRTPNAIRHLTRKRLLPKVMIDSKVQVRRLDLDELIRKSLT
jgi:hypothetical protein